MITDMQELSLLERLDANFDDFIATLQGVGLNEAIDGHIIRQMIDIVDPEGLLRWWETHEVYTWFVDHMNNMLDSHPSKEIQGLTLSKLTARHNPGAGRNNFVLRDPAAHAQSELARRHRLRTDYLRTSSRELTASLTRLVEVKGLDKNHPLAKALAQEAEAFAQEADLTARKIHMIARKQKVAAIK